MIKLKNANPQDVICCWAKWWKGALQTVPTLCGELRGGTNPNSREPYGASHWPTTEESQLREQRNSEKKIRECCPHPSSDSSLEILKWWRIENRAMRQEANLQPACMQHCFASNVTGSYPEHRDSARSLRSRPWEMEPVLLNGKECHVRVPQSAWETQMKPSASPKQPWLGKFCLGGTGQLLVSCHLGLSSDYGLSLCYVLPFYLKLPWNK